MTAFATQNPIDGCQLKGGLHPAKNAKAAMSLVHGFGEHQGRYAPMIAHLNQQGISVATLDLRGHGLSDGKRGVCHDYELMLGDVQALLNEAHQAFPDLPHVLYGHSMGGGLVMAYMLKRQPIEIKGVISSAPLLRPAEPIPGFLNGLVRLLRPLLPNMTIDNSISGDKISSLPDEQTKYEADPLNHGRLGLGLAVDMIDTGEWILSQAQNWDTPLLLMHAGQDQLTSWKASGEFMTTAQNAEFVGFFKNIQHEIHNDIQRDIVYENMLNFIDTIIETPS